MEKTARARGARAAAPVLPEELIVWEILIRLPAKTLLRCRAVCPAWRRLTSAADFLLAHHRHQPSLPLVSFDGDTYSSDNVDAAFDALDLGRRPTERQPVLRFNDYSHRRRFTVHASCDGLILLSLSNGRFYLCNPSTRQWISLPRLNGSRVAGMYSHSPSGEYRVLYWKGAHTSDAVDAVYYVLTVGSSEEPRCIGQPIASPSVQWFVGGGLMSEGPPVLLHECLHWICLRRQQQQAIVVFHTVDESFRLMRLPIGARQLAQYKSYPYLLEMAGTLGISWGSETMLELCVLNDYETEAWSLKCQIEFPVAEMSLVVQNPLFSGIIVSEDGDALIHSLRSSQLFHLDSKGKLTQTLQWDGMFPRATGFRFKESLFRHDFFKRPREGGRPRLPRFFRGL